MLPGAHHLTYFLSLDEQKPIVAECNRLGANLAGFYSPVLRNGNKMSVHMMCLGKHWNAKDHLYYSTREDVDGLQAQPIPEEFRQIAQKAAATVGMEISPDICIVNQYAKGGKLGLHRDEDESQESITRGTPIVSISIGDDAMFLFGGLERSDIPEKIRLMSGDAFVFGDKARMAYHGVTKVFSGTAPKELNVAGRFNLTFRQF
jgi:alkylated DNA repair protein (DNA oxidative demethylase)